MDRIPFGIRRLDTTIDGGAPSGSVVLLSGDAGAGAREFMYTSALMNALGQADADLFDLYYGEPFPAAVLPEEVHYVSFTSSPAQLSREMSLTMDDELVEAATDNLTFHDLSAEFFRLSPVPREWYAERTVGIGELGVSHDRKSVPEALGDTLAEHAPGNLVVIDSLTDLAVGLTDDLPWSSIPRLLKGLSRAAYGWGGLILAHVNHETLTPEQQGQLVDAAAGTFVFEWESGGSSRARTMVVKQFRGALSRIEEENIVRFETEISDSGFDISDVRKIR